MGWYQRRVHGDIQLVEVNFEEQTWPVQSKLPVNLPEERLLGNNWLPRLPGSLPPQLEESRNPIVIVPVPLLFVKLGVTKSQLNCLSASCPPASCERNCSGLQN